jgi:hypothetical protein
MRGLLGEGKMMTSSNSIRRSGLVALLGVVLFMAGHALRRGSPPVRYARRFYTASAGRWPRSWLRCCHLASEGVTLLVRGGVHRRRSRHDRVTWLWRQHPRSVRSVLAGARVYAVVAEGRVSSATLARELSRSRAARKLARAVGRESNCPRVRLAPADGRCARSRRTLPLFGSLK